jgi:DNA-binding MarR family transcriptional regulator
MNKRGVSDQNGYRSLMLLDEISKGAPLSQRDLSRRLNIALGLVNSFLKNLVAKGYIKIREVPSKRYAYYLTSKGFAEKSRLTYHYLYNYTRLYHNARKDFRALFGRLREKGIRTVAFAGIDMVAEIAYLSIQEAGISIAGVMDDEKKGGDFFRHTILSFDEVSYLECQGVVITTLSRADSVYGELRRCGVPEDSIWAIAPHEEEAAAPDGSREGELK